MKKRQSVDLKTLWDRASNSKTRRIVIESATNADGIEIPAQSATAQALGVNVVDKPQINKDVVVPENETEPGPETEIASNEPDLANNQLETTIENVEPIRDGAESESSDEEIYDADYLLHDPGKQVPIKLYGVNVRDSVIRGYIALGPRQPHGHNFPTREIGGKPRRFVENWFDEYRRLEYSVELDAAFCFVCYLFKHQINCSGGDAKIGLINMLVECLVFTIWPKRNLIPL